MQFRTPVSNLKASWLKYHARPAFKIPHEDGTWSTITYADFYHDVQVAANHWYHILQSDSISQRSVVGLCVRGYGYADLLHLYGLMGAGYIPQPFSILPNAQVIRTLLSQSKAQALIWDESYGDIFSDDAIDIVSYRVTQHYDFPLPEGFDSIPVIPVVKADDISLVLHTSGSTSGRPKLVPQTFRWLATAVAKARKMQIPISDPEKRTVRNWLGSICHTGQMFMLMSTVYHGGCTILPQAPRTTFSTTELINLIVDLGLTELCLFPSLLSKQLRAARQNSNLLHCLQKLDAVSYGGTYLPAEDIEWASQNGIKLMNYYGSTEIGLPILMSDYTQRDPRILRVLTYLDSEATISYRFDPISQTPNSLVELVILSTSGDCPSISNGDFHTGDLFERVDADGYVYRGRDDDWIKMANALRCDTSAIEENVRTLCSNLITECVVVGVKRPFPSVIVEIPPELEGPHASLKEEIFRRIQPSQVELLMHERIPSSRYIFIVQKDRIPRTNTKGNVRRRAAEDALRAELDEAYRELVD
ncbi:hypothetical protein VNI00_008125 [Paramarasmius palmivorus]|uniref:AMP-dependent synthetase/ligase domain-containing protein n=1 Tax=Paramarasmius palmivorus TaxID=297713 RepID=A0AAW0CXG9_9AGAR